MDGKKVAIIAGIAGVLLLCCCTGGIVAYFFLVGERASAPATDYQPPDYQPPDYQPPDHQPTVPAQPGWTTYVHTSPCPDETPDYVLTGFQLQHPPYLIAETCDTPGINSSYLRLTDYTPENLLNGQISFGEIHGAIPSFDPSLIDQWAASFQASLPPGSTMPVRSQDPYAIRGGTVHRRDYVMTFSQSQSGFTTDPYALRVLAILKPGTGNGFLLLLIRRHPGGIEAAFQDLEGDYRRVVESIRF